MGEEIKHHEEENLEEPIKYSDIEGELAPGAVLAKYWTMGPGAAERDVRKLGLDSEIEQKLLQGPYQSRDMAHLIRLLENGGVEATFATAYTQYADTVIPYNVSESRDILWVINSEGSDTTMFWTFAPYLFQALTEKDIAANEAISMILSWSKDGFSQAKPPPRGDSDRIHLRGLDFLNQYDRDQYVLSGGPDHVSHKFTAQEAKRIADLLIAQNNEKK